jgi:L-fucose mutarotase/ribose pyranase (RbsD/FucU family)
MTLVLRLQNTEGLLQDILSTNNLRKVVDCVFMIKVLKRPELMDAVADQLKQLIAE